MSSTLSWNGFLHEKVQKISSQQQEQSAADIVWKRKTEKLPTSGPVLRWENWKQKADVRTLPHLITETSEDTSGYERSLYVLTQQRDSHMNQREFTSVIEDEKEMAKLEILIAKLDLNYHLYSIYGSLYFDVFSDRGNKLFSKLVQEGFSSRSFLFFYTTFRAKRALKLNPYLKESYMLMDLWSIVHRNISSAIKINMELPSRDDKHFLNQLTEQDIEIKIPWLKSIKTGDFLKAETNSDFYIDLNKIQIIERKRTEYEKKIKIKKRRNNELMECRNRLADALSDLALENLTRIYESKIDTSLRSDLNEYWYFLISILEKVDKYSIRCALESLEWYPNHDQALKVLIDSSRLFLHVTSILKMIAEKIDEEKFFSSRLRALESPIATLSAEKEGSQCASSSNKNGEIGIKQNQVADLRNSGTDQKEKEDEVDTAAIYFFGQLFLPYVVIKRNILAAQLVERGSQQDEEKDIKDEIAELHSLVSVLAIVLNIREEGFSFEKSYKVIARCLLIIIFIIILILVISNDVWGCYLLYIL